MALSSNLNQSIYSIGTWSFVGYVLCGYWYFPIRPRSKTNHTMILFSENIRHLSHFTHLSLPFTHIPLFFPSFPTSHYFCPSFPTPLYFAHSQIPLFCDYSHIPLFLPFYPTSYYLLPLFPHPTICVPSSHIPRMFCPVFPQFVTEHPMCQ